MAVARTSKKPGSRAGVRAGSKGPAKSKVARKKRGRGSAPQGGALTGGRKKAAPQSVDEFARGLAETERIALIVRDELFGGSWENMRKDLEARAAGKPYVFRLASRIDEDLKAVAKLSAFERRRKVNLAEYLKEGQ